MDSAQTYKYITTAATTTFAGNETKRTVLHGIQINKTLVGTVTVKAGTTTIGVLAIGTLAGTHWQSTNGVEIESLTIVNSSSSDDITVFYTNIG